MIYPSVRNMDEIIEFEKELEYCDFNRIQSIMTNLLKYKGIGNKTILEIANRAGLEQVWLRKKDYLKLSQS